MAKYIILVESDMGKIFQEDFEEASGRTLRERVDEILTEGYKHTDMMGNFEVKPHLIRRLNVTKQK